MDDEKRDDESMETQLFFDMLMMVLVAGKERNKKEWVELISSAGYSDYKITPVLGLRNIGQFREKERSHLLRQAFIVVALLYKAWWLLEPAGNAITSNLFVEGLYCHDSNNFQQALQTALRNMLAKVQSFLFRAAFLR
ncbi:putative O-methyltransferase 3, partial [Mucuna pruriens]